MRDEGLTLAAGTPRLWNFRVSARWSSSREHTVPQQAGEMRPQLALKQKTRGQSHLSTTAQSNEVGTTAVQTRSQLWRKAEVSAAHLRRKVLFISNTSVLTVSQRTARYLTLFLLTVNIMLSLLRLLVILQSACAKYFTCIAPFIPRSNSMR